MNFLDAFIDEKIRKCYLKIMKIDEGNRNYINKNIEYANIRDKIRIFKIIVATKQRHNMDFSDDTKRINDLIIQKRKLLGHRSSI